MPLTGNHAICPCGCIQEELPLGLMIMHLNDRHRWTRERIADWVETVETVNSNVADEQEVCA
jgi:hypothetical protein